VLGLGDYVSSVSYQSSNALGVSPTYSLNSRCPASLIVSPRCAAVAFTSRVYKNKEFRQWANNWLANEDRTSLSAKEVQQTIQKEIQATSDLETLTAWGETGSDDEHIIHEIDDLVQRAQHVVTAVELFASASPDLDKAALEIAKALAGLDKFAKAIDLAALAEETCKNASVDQASFVDRVIAS